MPLSTGDKLGPYQILSPIGAGGIGEVYRAVDTRLGRKVAIKMAGREFTQRFEREARTIAALNHPNICALYDIGPHYLVMELLEGETLRGRLKRSPPDWRGAAEIAAAVAEGRRIVHRDLKPENIFLTQPADGTAGRTVILDFGLARWTASDVRAGETASVITQAGMIMGTVGYMSPEQVRGKATGPASDLFSLGCILYEMLAGRRWQTGRQTAAKNTTVEERSARAKKASDAAAKKRAAARLARERRNEAGNTLQRTGAKDASCR